MMSNKLVDLKIVDMPVDEVVPEPVLSLPQSQYFVRPTGWRVQPKMGLFTEAGELLQEIAFDTVVIYYPQIQSVQLLLQVFTEKAQKKFEDQGGSNGGGS